MPRCRHRCHPSHPRHRPMCRDQPVGQCWLQRDRRHRVDFMAIMHIRHTTCHRHSPVPRHCCTYHHRHSPVYKHRCNHPITPASSSLTYSHSVHSGLAVPATATTNGTSHSKSSSMSPSVNSNNTSPSIQNASQSSSSSQSSANSVAPSQIPPRTKINMYDWTGVSITRSPTCHVAWKV